MPTHQRLSKLQSELRSNLVASWRFAPSNSPEVDWGSAKCGMEMEPELQKESSLQGLTEAPDAAPSGLGFSRGKRYMASFTKPGGLRY